MRALLAATIVTVTACGLDVVGVGSVDSGVDANAHVDADADVDLEVDATSTAPVLDASADAPPDADIGCATPCKATAACEDHSCVDVASALVAFRYELACSGPAPGTPTSCQEPSTVPTKSITLAGTTGHAYDVHIHVRGIVEQRTYLDSQAARATGTNAAFFVTAPASPPEEWNSYPLTISDPTSTFYLNSGTSGHQYVDEIDYTVVVRANAGAKLGMHSEGSDIYIVKDVDQSSRPILVNGVPPAPQTFDGQFIQIDVDAVDAVP